MSKRSERREAERQARKDAYRMRREQQSQFAGLTPIQDGQGSGFENQSSATPDQLASPEARAASLPDPSASAPQSGDALHSLSAFNSTTHGCCATEVLVLQHERRDAFNALQTAWLENYRPANEAEQNLVEQLIAADWLNQRSVRTYAQVEAGTFTAEPNPLQWTDEQHKILARFLRYKTANQNAFHKARKAVEDHFKHKAAQADKAERLTIAKARHKVYELKNAPEPTFEEIMQLQCERAVALGRNPPPMAKRGF